MMVIKFNIKVFAIIKPFKVYSCCTYRFGCYLQSNGIQTIPTLGWSDTRSYEFCFAGIPRNGTVAVSSVGTQKDTTAKVLFKQGFERAIEVLTPSAVLFFGQIPNDLDVGGLQIVHYPHSFDVKFKAMRDGRKRQCV